MESIGRRRFHSRAARFGAAGGRRTGSAGGSIASAFAARGANSGRVRRNDNGGSGAGRGRRSQRGEGQAASRTRELAPDACAIEEIDMQSLDDDELRGLLRQWHAPPTPSSLEKKALAVSK